MDKQEVISKIRQQGIIAVVRGTSEQQVKSVIEQLIYSGIKLIELTFTVPFAHRIMEQTAKEFEGEIVLGAGTVLDAESARIAMLCGAEYIVSPHFSESVVTICARYKKTAISGFMTVTEAVNAMQAGADILKLFPASVFGPSYIKEIMAPLPQAVIIPTGGIKADNIKAWLSAGAVAVGAGSSLTTGDIKQNAQSFLREVAAYREENSNGCNLW